MNEKPNWRYFEIYVPGKNGYSSYFKTAKELPFQFNSSTLDYEDEVTIVELAAASRHFDICDSEIVKYVLELDDDDLKNIFNGKVSLEEIIKKLPEI